MPRQPRLSKSISFLCLPELPPDHNHTASSSLSQKRLPHTITTFFAHIAPPKTFCSTALRRRPSSSTRDTNNSPVLSSNIHRHPQVSFLTVRSLCACTADTSDTSRSLLPHATSVTPKRLCRSAHAPHTHLSSLSRGAVPFRCATQFFLGDDMPGKAFVDTVFSDVALKTVEDFLHQTWTIRGV
ncbi:hypothetical protein MIND_00560300 [Mycena indigotica]|uniref:Uncharacterized protein n=1 Tax=Mycena indigotica TaxID=2126181 RepID=A0A8H6SYS2_9AGAR|nr:uncharacterized protein MIND_00560300 [Mycena indigotica]KAF7307650.1 hypothetical protein MIND_00560300 [Mycena indigotica]